MPRYFVTSTGTDIGKTYVTSLLVRSLLVHGYAAKAYKPIMSGVAQWDSNDAAELLKAQGIAVTPEDTTAIAPWQFSHPLSPHRAAEYAQRPIDPASLVAWCRDQCALSNADDYIFIEGVGGVMVPITRDYTVLDWMRALNYPVLLVVGDYLGTLSHSLSALHVLHHANIAVHGVVVNSSPSPVEHKDACRTLCELSPYPTMSMLSVARKHHEGAAYHANILSKNELDRFFLHS
ncbi:MAG: dethiobiotin synthase [Alphaproteobacteria bacterium]|nr:MAG: dethiobiotin synthase [Alphaproteobacteria bacterium]